MTSIHYDEIFGNFLGNITDYDFANFTMSESFSIMAEYLHNALAESYVRRLFSTITIDDDAQIISFEMKHTVGEEEDKDFVINALSKWMVYEWLHKDVKSKNITSLFLGTKEQSMYSQANHLAQLRGLMDDSYKEARFYIQDRGYINNSYIGGAS